MDITDPASRPCKFRPEGYLVVIHMDDEAAQRAQVALVEAGFDPRDVKLYTGQQILENHEMYMGKRNVTAKAVGAVTDDSAGRDLYLGYAREDAMRIVVAGNRRRPRPRRFEHSRTTTTFTRVTTALTASTTFTSVDDPQAVIGQIPNRGHDEQDQGSDPKPDDGCERQFRTSRPNV